MVHMSQGMGAVEHDERGAFVGAATLDTGVVDEGLCVQRGVGVLMGEDGEGVDGPGTVRAVVGLHVFEMPEN